MKKLNLFPYYETLLRKKRKTTSIRLGNKTSLYKEGNIVELSIGWNEEKSQSIKKIKITSVESKILSEVDNNDVIGESPDCTKLDAIEYVLSAIYRKVVTKNDIVTIIKWVYI